MALKYSKQRAVIKDFLQGRTDHPTADTVYTNVRKVFPNISLGTVYRNLMVLTDAGEIKRVRVGDGSDHFDPVTSEHDHFVCSVCGSVSDLPAQEELHLEELAAKGFSGRITGHTLNFYGVCADCLAKEASA